MAAVKELLRVLPLRPRRDAPALAAGEPGGAALAPVPQPRRWADGFGALKQTLLRNRVAELPPQVRAGGMGPEYRAQVLQQLRAGKRYDVIIIGGGITGANALLEARTRGLSALLVEAGDFASGTSSRSTKLEHGGLRYLEQGRIGLVREASQERTRLALHAAPHLVTPMPFVYPTRTFPELVKIALGTKVYSALVAGSGFPRSSILSRKALERWAPVLNTKEFNGGALYWDASMDDALLTRSIIQTAHDYGADALNWTRATQFVKDESGRFGGVKLKDEETGEELVASATHIVNAAGPWSGEVEKLAKQAVGAAAKEEPRGSKGAHITLAEQDFPMPAAILHRASNGSVIIIQPWKRGPHGTVVAGTTETPHFGRPGEVTVTQDDSRYIRGEINSLVSDKYKVNERQVVSGQAGERPLVLEEGQTDTKSASREHKVFTEHTGEGLTRISGGKATTASNMAEDVIDAVFKDPALAGRAQRSVRKQLKINGADGFHELSQQTAALAKAHHLTQEQVGHLLSRYGGRAQKLLERMDAVPALREPIPGAPQYLRAEVEYVVKELGARRLEDVLDRAMRIHLETPHRGLDSAEPVARQMGELLGWDEPRVALELSRYRAFVQKESGELPIYREPAAESVRWS